MTIILAALAWLLTYLLHSTVFLVGACALVALGLVRSHAARDTLWKVALLGGLVTATAQTTLRLQPWAGHVALAAQPESPLVDVAGVRDLRLAPAAPESTPAAAAFASAIAQREIAELPPAPAPRARSIHRLFSGVHVSWPAMLLQLWFMGALAFGARMLWARFQFARRLQWRRPVDGPLAEALAELCAAARVPPPRLTVSDRLAGPIAFGREICVPERMVISLTPSEQRAVLAHELGHVVRRDPAWLITAACIESVCFVQPLNRLARRRLREVSEYLCDDWAAQRTDGIVVARCLAEVAGWVQGQPVPATVAGMAGHCSELVSRVERLLNGAEPTRPARRAVRAGAGALALTLVAWAVPGVAAEDIGDVALAPAGAWEAPDDDAVAVTAAGSRQGSLWGELRDGGRLIVFAPGWAARLSGKGRLGFREYGRSIVVAEGYTVTVAGDAVTDDRALCDQSGPVRIVGPDGAWDLVPVRLAGAPANARSRGHAPEIARITAEALGRASASARAEGRAEARSDARADARAEASADARADAASDTDEALHGEADAAIDTLVRLWVRDPEAVRRAARRIARTYDRDLRPQFESLGVEVGRDLAPQLQRLTTRLGRDLTPEFARLGAALGAAIVSSLEPEGHGVRAGKQGPRK